MRQDREPVVVGREQRVFVALLDGLLKLLVDASPSQAKADVAIEQREVGDAVQRDELTRWNERDRELGAAVERGCRWRRDGVKCDLVRAKFRSLGSTCDRSDAREVPDLQRRLVTLERVHIALPSGIEDSVGHEDQARRMRALGNFVANLET